VPSLRQADLDLEQERTRLQAEAAAAFVTVARNTGRMIANSQRRSQ
jgi:hypothetical protein